MSSTIATAVPIRASSSSSSSTTTTNRSTTNTTTERPTSNNSNNNDNDNYHHNNDPTTSTSTTAFPMPPMAFYPIPPSEPIWSEERQSQHVLSLHAYITAIFDWMEVCREQMIFQSIKVRLPVAPLEEWEAFLFQTMTCIHELMAMLKSWMDDDDAE